jgi:short-chain fatty acids transporter
MQMCLVLMTGHILAQTKPMAALLRTIAKAANTPFKAVALACVVMIVTSYLNWGFGLIFTSLLAIEIARNMKGKGLHYPLLVASAYSGFLVWHAGLSASAPLLVNTQGHFLQAKIGLIPVSQTIFSPIGYVPVLVLLITLLFIMAGMHPKKEQVIEVDPSVFVEKKEKPKKDPSQMTHAERMENSMVLSLIIGIIGLIYVFYYFFVKKVLWISTYSISSSSWWVSCCMARPGISSMPPSKLVKLCGALWSSSRSTQASWA